MTAAQLENQLARVYIAAMEFTEEMQSYLDVQWFAVDVEGNIASFWSGGSELPSSIGLDKDANDNLNSYFSSFPIRGESQLNPTDSLVSKINLANSEKNWSTLEGIALRGIFAYDIAKPGRFSSELYLLKAKPELPLSIFELSEELSVILNKTKFMGKFKECNEIRAKEIG